MVMKWIVNFVLQCGDEDLPKEMFVSAEGISQALDEAYNVLDKIFPDNRKIVCALRPDAGVKLEDFTWWRKE